MSQSIRSILRIVLLYIIFAALWIFFSDEVAHFLEASYQVPREIETLKGLVFVLVSGSMLFALLFRVLKEREVEYQAHLQEKESLLAQVTSKNQELLDAYDKTIFGWSRVLEKNNREVKDHSRRVTDMTVRLAKYMGVPEDELIHIRRGALLHDIGKMAISDSILTKNGRLNKEERALINRHPLFGFEMISEIEFLRPSVDILLCHHEKWDGTGYPFGLAGEQIPLFARIFAVVDVWDALCYERPYRKADPPEVIVEYLRSQAGEHFDPEIVEAFLNMLKEEGYQIPEVQPYIPFTGRFKP